jgi:4-diphosphocytidyl-2-C-methyl-D-erythritol kinase
MLTFPNCKINIGLFVTRRRDDGYHELETVFYPYTPLHDALEAVPSAAGQPRLHISGSAVAGAMEDNLVWKAWELLARSYPDRVRALDIYLLKKIPMGAGLGGGSADAAFTLKMLNKYFELQLNEQELAELALQLGSDCPFFIYNSPQYATGRGEVMTPLSLDLSGYTIQLICPQLHVSTAAAFKAIRPRPASFDLRQLPSVPVAEWREVLRNDFEEPVFEMHPGLARIKEQMYQQGALYASMSGSGSAIYGIFPEGKRAVVETEFSIRQY